MDARQSYWHSPMKTPLTCKTLNCILEENAATHPDKEIYVVRRRNCPRETITIGELHAKSAKLAQKLYNMGLNKGDAVIITGITCMNWIICDYACMKLGLVPLKSRMSVLTKEGMETIIQENKVKAILFHPGEDHEFEDHLRKMFPELLNPRENQDHLDLLSTVKVSIAMAECRPECTVPTVDILLNSEEGTHSNFKDSIVVESEDIASVYMTSGSTGAPKAIPYTHFAHVNCMATVEERRDHSTSVFFTDRSLAWVASDVFFPLMTLSRKVFVHPLTAASDNDFDFCLQVIREEKCNSALLLQYMLHDMLKRFDDAKEDPIFFDIGISGGELLQMDLFKRASKYVKHFIFGYGSTEAMSIASSVESDDLHKKLEFAGKVSTGVEVKIVNKSGHMVPMGQVGEILVRSPFVLKRFLNKKPAVDESGWYHTDDAGFMTSDGYIKVLGRMSFVISRGITLTYPTTVEKLLLKHDAVDKAAVVGVPDERLGETIAAFIAPKPGTSLTKELLQNFFKNQYQTDEGLGMTPDYFFIVETLPLNANGKIDIKLLKEQAIGMANGTSGS